MRIHDSSTGKTGSVSGIGCGIGVSSDTLKGNRKCMIVLA